MRRLICLLLLTMALLALVPPAAANPVSSGPLDEFMGMVVRDPHYEWKTNVAFPEGANKAFFDAMGRNLEAAGVRWVRLEFFAEEFAESSSRDLRGKVNVEKYAYFINEVAPRHNLKVLALLATPLVRQRLEGDPLRFPGATYGPGQYIDPERLEDPLTIPTSDYGYVNPYMRIWLDNAFRIAATFPYVQNRDGRWQGIAAYEVLNEQNRYLLGGGKGLDPNAVATLQTKFYRVFRAGGPTWIKFGAWRNDVKIITGGLHPDRCDDCMRGDGGRGMTDRQYLDALYKSGAFQDYKRTHGRYPLDGVGYHPYAAEMRAALVPEETAIDDLFRVPQRMQELREIMIANGDAATKIWITEIGDRGAPVLEGYPSTEARRDNERRQATFMRTIYWMMWQNREFVERVFWFKYEDFAVPDDPNQTGPENWGVVRLYPRPTSEPCPQPATYGSTSCDYRSDGGIWRFKESYAAYQDMAFNGITT